MVWFTDMTKKFFLCADTGEVHTRLVSVSKKSSTPFLRFVC